MRVIFLLRLASRFINGVWQVADTMEFTICRELFSNILMAVTTGQYTFSCVENNHCVLVLIVSPANAQMVVLHAPKRSVNQQVSIISCM